MSWEQKRQGESCSVVRDAPQAGGASAPEERAERSGHRPRFVLSVSGHVTRVYEMCSEESHSFYSFCVLLFFLVCVWFSYGPHSLHISLVLILTTTL